MAALHRRLARARPRRGRLRRARRRPHGAPPGRGAPHDRAVPVPRGAHAVVRHRSRREALPLLRLRRRRRRLQVRRWRRRGSTSGAPSRASPSAPGSSSSARRRTRATPSAAQQRARLLAVLERAAAFYARMLWESAEAEPARAYLAGRGLEEGALREFRVGWSPRAWDRVVGGSRRAGYAEAELLAAGLAVRRRDGSGLLDRFRGRIMFPLADERGRVLGFGARALGAGRAAEVPQHVGERALPQGADGLRRRPRPGGGGARAGRVVLVEGYTDVIALHQAGIPETVCSMGTALTDVQVDALKRLAPQVLLCQDPDAAGQEAVGQGDGRDPRLQRRARRRPPRGARRAPAAGPRPRRRRPARTAPRRCGRCSRLGAGRPVRPWTGRSTRATSRRPRAATGRCASSRRSSAGSARGCSRTTSSASRPTACR